MVGEGEEVVRWGCCCCCCWRTEMVGVGVEEGVGVGERAGSKMGKRVRRGVRKMGEGEGVRKMGEEEGVEGEVGVQGRCCCSWRSSRCFHCRCCCCHWDWRLGG